MVSDWTLTPSVTEDSGVQLSAVRPCSRFYAIKTYFRKASLQKIAILWEEESQLDATQCSVELVICSTCFGHVYARHQELATVLLVWQLACNSWLLVVGRSGAGSRLCVWSEECCSTGQSIKHCVASSWFSSFRITTMHEQTHVKFTIPCYLILYISAIFPHSALIFSALSPPHRKFLCPQEERSQHIN